MVLNLNDSNAVTKKRKSSKETQFNCPQKREKRRVSYRKKRKLHRENQKRELLSYVADNLGEMILGGLSKILQTHFSDLESRLEQLPDVRKRTTYSISELVFAGIMLYVLNPYC